MYIVSSRWLSIERSNDASYHVIDDLLPSYPRTRRYIMAGVETRYPAVSWHQKGVTPLASGAQIMRAHLGVWTPTGSMA